MPKYTQWQDPVSIPFVGGIDTKSDEKTVQATELVTLENGVFEEMGSIRKRFGYDKIEGLSDAQVVSSYKDELIAAAVGGLYSERNDAWTKMDDFHYVSIAKKDVAEMPEQQINADRAQTSSLRAYVWEDSRGGVYCSLQDVETGQWLVDDNELSSTGIDPRVVAVGNQIYMVWVETGSTNIDYATVNNNSPTSITTGTLISDVHADGVYDITPGTDGTYYFIAYKSTAANDLRATRFTGTTADITVDTGQPEAPSLVSVAASDEYLAVVWTDGTAADLSIFCVDAVNSSYVYNAQIDVLTGASDISNLSVTINEFDTTQNPPIHGASIVYSDNDNFVQFAQANLPDLDQPDDTLAFYHSSIASQAFTVNNKPYVILKHESNLSLQNGYYLVNLPGFIDGSAGTSKIIAQFGQGEAPVYQYDKYAGGGTQRNYLPGVEVDGNTFRTALMSQKRLQLETDDSQNTDAIVYAEIGIIDVEGDLNDSSYAFHEVGETLYTPGGLLWSYDGFDVVEGNFMLYPEPAITLGGTSHSFVSVATTGGNIAAGTYAYKIVYERKNGQGERVRSASIPFSVAVGGTTNGEVTLTIPTLAHTRSDDVYIVVYRTEDGGTQFYRVSDIDPTNSTGDNRFVDNDRTAASVEFIDVLVDSDITDNEREDTTGGVIANIAIPSGTLMAQSKRRAFVAGGEIEPYRVYYSKLRRPGRSLEFNDQFYIDVDERGGPITGLATLQDALVVFKEKEIFLVNGDGPSNLGQGDFQAPIQVSTDSGCVAPNALVEMPGGIMYKSSKGIYLLGNNGLTQYIGAKVEGFNSLNTVDAQLLPDDNAILFLHSDGVGLYYDYNFNQWSTFTNHSGISATIHQGNYVYLTDADDVFVQNNNNYRDGNVPYALRFRTGPIRLNGLQEWWRCKRVYLLGEYFTPHNLQVDVYYNRDGAPKHTQIYEPTDFIDTATWGSQTTWGADSVWGGDGQDYQVSLAPKFQKVQTISFEFTEIPDSASNGRSFQLTELAILWAPLKGLGRLEASRRK